MGDEFRWKANYWWITALIIALGLVSLLIFQFVLAKAKPARNQCEDPLLLDLRTQLANVPTDKVEARNLLQGKIEMFETMAAICETVTPATVNPNAILQYPPPLTPYPKRNCAGIEIEMFRTQLALVPSHDVLKRESVERKIKAWETMIAVCEKVTPPTVNPYETPQFPPTRTPYPFVTGIFEGQTGVFHSFEAKIENHWRGIINGDRVFVYAGAWVDDPSQGFIAVHIYPDKGHSAYGNIYPSPTKSGALRIVDVRGSRLVVQQANDQNLLFFDVPSLSYVNSLDETVVPRTPTAVPTTAQPTINPYPYPFPYP
jgi:hypothetical protein